MLLAVDQRNWLDGDVIQRGMKAGRASQSRIQRIGVGANAEIVELTPGQENLAASLEPKVSRYDVLFWICDERRTGPADFAAPVPVELTTSVS